MSTNILEHSMLQGVQPILAKKSSVSKFLISLALLVLGILLFVIVFHLTDHSSTLSMALMVLGSLCILISTFRFFWKSKDLFYLPTRSKVSEQSLFFNLKALPFLSQLIRERNFETSHPISSEANGNVRLDVLFTKDRQFVALQLFQFVPYTYTPVTSVTYFQAQEAERVYDYLTECKVS